MTKGFAALVIASDGTNTGQAYFNALPTTSGLGSGGSSTSSSTKDTTRGWVVGTGIPSKPLVILTDSGATITTSLLTATTSQEMKKNPVPPPSVMRSILY